MVGRGRRRCGAGPRSSSAPRRCSTGTGSLFLSLTYGGQGRGPRERDVLRELVKQLVVENPTWDIGESSRFQNAVYVTVTE
jgi:hypothetical protein